MSFHSKVERATAVVLAVIKSVNLSGSRVKIDIKKCYKGDINGRIKIEVPLSWMPEKWFIKDELALIFLRDDDNGTLLSIGTNSRMPLVRRDDVVYLNHFNRGLGDIKSFWDGFDVLKIKSDEWENVIEVPFNDVEFFLESQTK